MTKNTDTSLNVKTDTESTATTAPSQQVLTFKYGLLPTCRQHQALRQILEQQRLLYNDALAERIDYYQKEVKAKKMKGIPIAKGKSGISYMDQCKSLTIIRKADPMFAVLPLNIQRGTIKRLDEAYKAFFKRVASAKGKAGFPKFRGKKYWTSFDFRECDGLRFDGKRLRFSGGLPGGLRVRLHRPLPAGKILTAKFKCDYKGWSVCLSVRVDNKAKPPLTSKSKKIGIDLGIKTYAATSDGEEFRNPRFAQEAKKEMRRRQRALARCQKKSNRRRKIHKQVTRLHAKIVNCRATYLHQISASLVARYDYIAIENLNIKGLARGMLSGPVHDVAWGKFDTLLKYKAEKAGVYIVAVNPHYTSQDCAKCGERVPKRLKDREHHCPNQKCGYVEDRDINAAQVILQRAEAQPTADPAPAKKDKKTLSSRGKKTG